MTKYLIAFKGYRKLNIEAPNEPRAKEWAERQLAHWRQKYEFSITDLTAEEASQAAAKKALVEARKQAQAETKKEKKAKNTKP